MEKIKFFLKGHWIEITVAFVAIAALHLPLIADTFKGDHIDSTKAADYGQFLSGYAGTIILIISVAALVIQLRNQIANNARASFESRFFELLRYHRENVAEIGIGDKAGRRVFVTLIREFRETHKLVGKICDKAAPGYAQLKRLDLAYMSFYYGVGPNSTRVLDKAIEGKHPDDLIKTVIAKMKEVQDGYHAAKNEYKSSHQDHSAKLLRDAKWKALTNLPHCPYDGHQSRLAHYFRHLYQLVKYANQHAPSGTADEYANLIRAQLTNHEQALLSLNVLSPIGAKWIKLDYINKYDLIKNIPKGFFNSETEMDINQQFPKIVFEFESPEDESDEPNRSRVG